jgi:membrane-associated phospholipid phosphatase
VTARHLRAVRLALGLPGGYLVCTAPLVVRTAVNAGDPTPVIALTIAIALIGLALWPDRRDGAFLRALRDGLPLALMLFVYVELRWLMGVSGFAHADTTVQAWEATLFPANPARTLATRFHSVLLSETLHLAYLSFYAIVVAPPVVLLLRGRRDAFAFTILSLTLVFVVQTVCFLLFPVDGPRYIFGPAGAPDGPVRSAVLHVLSAGSSPGTAFPSLHVSASVVASYCAFRVRAVIGVGLGILTTGLAIGAVYGGFHYGVDVVAGLAVGALCSMSGTVMWHRLGGV